MNAVDRISMAARMSIVLKESMENILDREAIMNHIKEIGQGCRVFGISIEGKTLRRIKLELEQAIKKEIR